MGEARGRSSECETNARRKWRSNDSEPECSQGPPAKKKREDKPHESSSRRATTCPQLTPPDVSNEWDLGPELTAQDAIQRFGPYVRSVSAEAS